MGTWVRCTRSKSAGGGAVLFNLDAVSAIEEHLSGSRIYFVGAEDGRMDVEQSPTRIANAISSEVRDATAA